MTTDLKKYNMVEFHPYPVSDPIWLGTKELHVPWTAYDLTLCGIPILEREDLEKKSLTRSDHPLCETCLDLNDRVIKQYNNLKGATND